MIRSAALKLMFYYLGILMALSIGLSIAIYRISTNELRRPVSVGGNTLRVTELGIPGQSRTFGQLIDDRADESAANLRANLILLNLAVLAVGSGLSYALALRTLKPFEEAFDAQTRFISDASHELKTPLTAMQTEIEVGLRNPKLKTPEAKALLASNLEEVKKLSTLTSSLLKLTGQNGRDLPKESVNLQSVVKEAISQLELAAKQKDITINSQLTDATVLGDSFSLKEVVCILLDNSIKYSPDKTTVQIDLGSTGHHAELTVRDQGQGIKASDLPHIFDRFYRADLSRSKLNVEGYGLGLSIAQKIVHNHDGTISADSKAGEGASFKVRLPLENVQ